MKLLRLMWIVFAGALLAPTAGFAQISCSREGLQRAVADRGTSAGFENGFSLQGF